MLSAILKKSWKQHPTKPSEQDEEEILGTVGEDRKNS